MFVYVCVHVKGMYDLEWKFVTAAFHMFSLQSSFEKRRNV